MSLITWHDLLRQFNKVIKHHKVTQLACQLESLLLKCSLLSCSVPHYPASLWLDGVRFNTLDTFGYNFVPLSQHCKGKGLGIAKLG